MKTSSATIWVYLGLSIFGGVLGIHVCLPAHTQANQQGRTMSTDEIFREMTLRTGRPYLEAESQLRKEGAAAAPTLRSQLKHPDDVNRLTAKCMLDWIEGRAADNDRVLEHLNTLPVRIARTAMGVPSPTGTAEYIDLHFGPRVAEILALRLVKERDWPHWKIMTVLFYLRNSKVVSTNGAVIRFAAETENAEWRDAAIETLKATNDRDVVGKLQNEKDRQRAANRAFPEALEGLLSRP